MLAGHNEVSDQCDCRGQCARHEKRRINFFGNAHLFDSNVDKPTPSKRGGSRRLCPDCAPSFDPNRRSRERRSERALTERPRVGIEYLKSLDERIHGKR